MNRVLATLALLAAAHAGAQAPRPEDFAWRASVDASPHTGLVRLPLPADALVRLQSASADDLRVLDAQGRPVPFALHVPPGPAQAPAQPLAEWPALPLQAARGGAVPPAGSAQVRLESGGGQQTVWVRLGPGTTPERDAPVTLPAALFDTRGEQRTLGAITVSGVLPPNQPVQLTLSSSTDLAHWEPVPLRGRVYQFDGPGAPQNRTLQLASPLPLQGRFLRLDWSGYAGVTVRALTGLLPPAQPAPDRPSAPLPPPRSSDDVAREWQLDFATPIAQLAIRSERPDTVVPVRILGRNNASQPWQTLGHTVIYRVGTGGQESSNPQVPLAGVAVRWLRIEALHQQRLGDLPLAVQVLFEPREVVFVAGASGPYRVVAGRSDTPAAALPIAMLAATTGTRVDALPAARITAVEASPQVPQPAWARALPAGVDSRTAILWAVLLAGVLVLGAVAWALLRQLKAPGP